ncbi:SGNH/GDSL hydrolase family protein [Planctomonas psychrotolerans]|uniref:SGNH/GDSL hydrolase family protein n=1 Tax=Planctomonas psychrotolerans TaxID=2528712 RepID=UPI001D0D74F9|nr:SGNH/GDSL hydrolase family protein [Planctomonas psychrotolerans]
MSSRKSTSHPFATALLFGGLVAGTTIGRRVFRSRREASALILNETLPVHSKWWRDQVKVKGDILYVALGDSAAQGIGATKPENSYVGILAEHIRQRTGSSVHVVNLSISGARVEDAIERQLPRLLDLTPDIVTVSIGANDMADFEPERFGRSVRRLFSALPASSLVADLPSFHLADGERKVTVANRIVHRAIAANGLTHVPLYKTTRRQTIALALTQVAGDFFHPNDRGYRVWASAFLPALNHAIAKLD